jgi:Protein of unknown function (DUF541)
MDISRYTAEARSRTVIVAADVRPTLVCRILLPTQSNRRSIGDANTSILTGSSTSWGKADSTVAERLKSVLATLSAKHVSPGDIESFSINKQILTNNEYGAKGPAVIRGYDVSRALKFTVRQLDSLPAIESSMVGEPNIENIYCRFDRKDRQSIEADLLTKALQSARDQADRMFKKSADPNLLLVPSTISMSATVNVLFKME